MTDLAYQAYQIYSYLLPATLAWAIFRGWRSERFGLVRCAFAVGVHWVATIAWVRWAMPENWQGQPFIFYLLSLFVVLLAVTTRPSDKRHFIVGGFVLGGIVSSAIYGAWHFWNGYSEQADWTYWISIHGMGWAVMATLVGWTHEQNLRSIFLYIVDPIRRLWRNRTGEGVAR